MVAVTFSPSIPANNSSVFSLTQVGSDVDIFLNSLLSTYTFKQLMNEDFVQDLVRKRFPNYPNIKVTRDMRFTLSNLRIECRDCPSDIETLKSNIKRDKQKFNDWQRSEIVRYMKDTSNPDYWRRVAVSKYIDILIDEFSRAQERENCLPGCGLQNPDVALDYMHDSAMKQDGIDLYAIKLRFSYDKEPESR
jgi:hypothetical protein